MKLKKLKSFTALVLAAFMALSCINVWALGGYSDARESFAAAVSLPVGNTDGQADVSIRGNTVANILSNAGDCEETGKWADSNTIHSLDSLNKLYGGSGFKIQAKATPFGNIFRSINSIDKSKYYLLSAYLKNGNASKITLMKQSLSGAPNKFAEVTDTTRFNRVAVKLSPSDFGTDEYAAVIVYGAVDQYAYADGIMLNEISANEYNTLTQAELLAKYPYINDLKSSASVRIKSTGKNFINLSNISSGRIIGGDSAVTNNTMASADVLDYETNKISITSKAADTGFVTDFIAVQPNTAYTVSTAGVQVSALNPYIANISYFDESRSYKGFSSGDASQLTQSFTTPEGASYIRISFVNKDITTSIINNIQLEKGTAATAYEPYRESAAYYSGELKSLPNGTTDEVNITDSTYIKRISDCLTLDGRQSYVCSGDRTGFKEIALGVSNARNGGAYVLKYTGITIPDPNAALSQADQQSLSGNILYITVNDSDTGWTETMMPAMNEIQAYFNGWKLCAGDGSVYVSGTKYWKRITDGGGLTSTVPAASYSGYKSYRVMYQLAKPQTYKLTPQTLMGFKNGSLTMDKAIKASAQYASRITIANSNLPIQSLESVSKLESGIIRPVDISSIAIASDGLSFTIPGAKSGEVYEYIYRYRDELGTFPSIKYSVPMDTSAQTGSSTNIMKSYNDFMNRLLARIDALETLTAAKTRVNASTIQASCTAGQTFSVTMSAANVQQVDKCVFTIMYDPAKVQVTDLCAATADKELKEGYIQGGNVMILKHDTSTGLIIFTIDAGTAVDSTWSGAVNIIEFKALSDGQTAITYTIQ